MAKEASRNGLAVTADTYGCTFSGLDLDSGRYSTSENDLILALKHPLVMVGGVSFVDEKGKAGPPRAYGNYPRILRRYVGEEPIIPWETAIKKMTSMPAKRLGLTNQGVLETGYKADIVIFDPLEVSDFSIREEPSILFRGMHYHGNPVAAEGEPTGILAEQGLKNLKR